MTRHIFAKTALLGVLVVLLYVAQVLYDGSGF